MEIIFYIKQNNRCPVKEFIEDLEVKDKAKILACLKSIEELGYDTPRVQFRQIAGRLWEIKIRSVETGYRIFYVGIKPKTMILLHAFQKQSQKTPQKEIEIAKQRLLEVMKNEKDYTERHH